MIQYTTSDIINKARELGDLQNSDFISYKENLTLLNDAYSQLYQKTINAGDLIYLKCYELHSAGLGGMGQTVSFELPCDFYQLYSVREGDGTLERPLLRKPKDALNITKGYDIINNQLIIYGCTFGDIKVEYFPTPKTLFIKNEDKKLEDSYGKPVACNENITLYLDNVTLTGLSDENYFKQWKLTESIEPVKITIEKIDAGVNGFICFFTENGKKKILSSDWNEDGSIVTDNSDKKVVRYGDENGIFLEDKLEGELEGSYFGNSLFIMKQNELVEYSLDENEEIIEEVSRIELPGFNENAKIAYQKDGVIYFINNKDLFTYDIYSQELTKIKCPRTNEFIDVANIDFASGYGYLVNKLGRGYYIASCYEDTVLDYPNNFYFNYLSYMLAIQYKNKQEADAAALRAAAAEAEEQYYDTFKRDVNGFIRMNNVHGY